jgi:hypothetical protein
MITRSMHPGTTDPKEDLESEKHGRKKFKRHSVARVEELSFLAVEKKQREML